LEVFYYEITAAGNAVRTSWVTCDRNRLEQIGSLFNVAERERCWTIYPKGPNLISVTTDQGEQWQMAFPYDLGRPQQRRVVCWRRWDVGDSYVLVLADESFFLAVIDAVGLASSKRPDFFVPFADMLRSQRNVEGCAIVGDELRCEPWQ
jgi:hypothetical protein